MKILLSIKSLGLNTGKDGLSMFAVAAGRSLLVGSRLISDQTGLQSVAHLTVRGTFYDLGFSKHLHA